MLRCHGFSGTLSGSGGPCRCMSARKSALPSSPSASTVRSLRPHALSRTPQSERGFVLMWLVCSAVAEARALGDDSLQREITLLARLAATSPSPAAARVAGSVASTGSAAAPAPASTALSAAAAVTDESQGVRSQQREMKRHVF